MASIDNNGTVRMDPWSKWILAIVGSLVVIGIGSLVAAELAARDRLPSVQIEIAKLSERVATLVTIAERRHSEIETLRTSLLEHLADPTIHQAGSSRLSDRLDRIEVRLENIERRLGP